MPRSESPRAGPNARPRPVEGTSTRAGWRAPGRYNLSIIGTAGGDILSRRDECASSLPSNVSHIPSLAARPMAELRRAADSVAVTFPPGTTTPKKPVVLWIVLGSVGGFFVLCVVCAVMSTIVVALVGPLPDSSSQPTSAARTPSDAARITKPTPTSAFTPRVDIATSTAPLPVPTTPAITTTMPVSQPTAMTTTEALTFVGPIVGTMTVGLNPAATSNRPPAQLAGWGEVRTTQCFEWNDESGYHDFDARVFGSVNGTKVELQLTEVGDDPVSGRHKVFVKARATIGVIPDGSNTDQWLMYPTADPAYFTVDGGHRSGTVDVRLTYLPYIGAENALHIYGRWNC